MSLKNIRMGGQWLPDQPGHDWDAKPPAIKGVSSKPSNEKTISLEELNEITSLSSRFLIKEQRRVSNSIQEMAKMHGVGD